MVTSAMVLKQLKLENVSAFASLDLTLDPALTLLVGRNGSGKTSVLRAIAIAGSNFASQIFGRPALERSVPGGFLRNGATACRVDTWWGDDGRFAMVATGPDEEYSLREFVWPDHTVPPLVIFYSVDRARTRRDAVARAPGAGITTEATVRTATPAWDDEINGELLPFEVLTRWFREREDLENQERVERRSFDHHDVGLSAVRAACAAVLGPEYGPPRIDRSRGTEMVLDKNGLRLTVEQLSDGERALLVLAANVARRLALLVPEGTEPLRASALLLIDEVELHLHPAWQERVLPGLRRAFPNMQIVATTHSPSVLASVQRSDQVRILEAGSAYSPSDPVTGRDANSLLVEVFGAHARPLYVEAMVQEASRAIDEEDLTRASAEIDTIERVCGAGDPEVIRLRTMVAFLRDEAS